MAFHDLHPATGLQIRERLSYLSRQPTRQGPFEFILSHGMAGDDSNNRIHYILIFSQVEVTFCGMHHLGDISQNGYSPHQAFFVRRLDPCLGWRAHRQVNVNRVRPDLFQDTCNTFKNLGRVIQSTHQHHLNP